MGSEHQHWIAVLIASLYVNRKSLINARHVIENLANLNFWLVLQLILFNRGALYAIHERHVSVYIFIWSVSGLRISLQVDLHMLDDSSHLALMQPIEADISTVTLFHSFQLYND